VPVLSCDWFETQSFRVSSAADSRWDVALPSDPASSFRQSKRRLAKLGMLKDVSADLLGPHTQAKVRKSVTEFEKAQ